MDEHKAFPNFPACLKASERITQAVQAHYKPNYWDKVRGDEVESQAVAEELFDTAVNCGTGTACHLLDRLLNVGNRNQKDWPDAADDGIFSDEDLNNVRIMVGIRGEKSVVKALNVLQGKRYYEICEKNPAMEGYFWGWIINRA